MGANISIFDGNRKLGVRILPVMPKEIEIIMRQNPEEILGKYTVEELKQIFIEEAKDVGINLLLTKKIIYQEVIL